MTFNTSFWYIFFGKEGSFSSRIKDFPKYELSEEDGYIEISITKPNLLTGADAGNTKNFSYAKGKDYSLEFDGYCGLLGFLVGAGNVTINTPQWPKPRTFEWISNVKDLGAELGYKIMTQKEVMKVKIGAYSMYALLLTVIGFVITTLLGHYTVSIVGFLVTYVLALVHQDLFEEGKNFKNLITIKTRFMNWIMSFIKDDNEGTSKPDRDPDFGSGEQDERYLDLEGTDITEQEPPS